MWWTADWFKVFLGAALMASGQATYVSGSRLLAQVRPLTAGAVSGRQPFATKVVLDGEPPVDLEKRAAEPRVVAASTQGFSYKIYVVSDPVAFRQLTLPPAAMVTWNGLVMAPGYQFTSSAAGTQITNADIRSGDYVGVVSLTSATPSMDVKKERE